MPPLSADGSRRRNPSHPDAAVRRSVWLLAMARVCDMAGAEAIFTVRSYDLYDSTDSALWLSALLFAFFVGLTLGEPLGGVLGDRFDRRHVLLWSVAVQALVLSSLIVVVNPIAVVAITFVAALAAAPFNSTLPAAVPSLAGESYLGWANGVVNAGMNLGLVLGPPIGAALLDWQGAGLGIAMGIGFILAGGLAIALIPGSFAAADSDETSGQFREGLAWVMRDPVLRAVMVGWMVLMAGLGVVLVAEVPLATEFGWGALGYAALSVAWGIGAVTGSLLGRYVRARHETGAVVVGLIGLGLAMLVVAVDQHPLPVLLALLGGGLTDSAGEVAAQSTFQRRTPDQLRARTMAVLNTAGIGALAVSFLLAGPLLERVGVAGAYGVSAAASFAAALLVVFMLRRDLRGGTSTR